MLQLVIVRSKWIHPPAWLKLIWLDSIIALIHLSKMGWLSPYVVVHHCRDHTVYWRLILSVSYSVMASICGNGFINYPASLSSIGLIPSSGSIPFNEFIRINDVKAFWVQWPNVTEIAARGFMGRNDSFLYCVFIGNIVCRLGLMGWFTTMASFTSTGLIKATVIVCASRDHHFTWRAFPSWVHSGLCLVSFTWVHFFRDFVILWWVDFTVWHVILIKWPHLWKWSLGEVGFIISPDFDFHVWGYKSTGHFILVGFIWCLVFSLKTRGFIVLYVFVNCHWIHFLVCHKSTLMGWSHLWSRFWTMGSCIWMSSLVFGGFIFCHIFALLSRFHLTDWLFALCYWFHPIRWLR